MLPWGKQDPYSPQVQRWQDELLVFMRDKKSGLLKAIEDKGVMDDDLTAKVKAALDEFNAGFKL